MCGGFVCKWKIPKHFYKYKGEYIVQRTVNLLKKSGIKKSDIVITTQPDCVDKYKIFGVEVIPYDSNKKPFVWLDAFYLIDEPVCYIFGDVVFSAKAIKTIVKTQTDDIEFFASAPPFAPNYPKKYAEPFAFKVVNYKRFRDCILRTKECDKYCLWYRRPPISWELWQIIKGTIPNQIVYTNYTVINDYTCDVDYPEEIKQW